jgi:hypothetical protein
MATFIKYLLSNYVIRSHSRIDTVMRNPYEIRKNSGQIGKKTLEFLQIYKIQARFYKPLECQLEDHEAIIKGTFNDKYYDFDVKIQFLVDDEKISKNQKVILNFCHIFRNEAYHLNKLRGGIIGV